MGLDRAGWTCVGQVEIDPFCRRVLDQHWPGVPKHDDVQTCVEWWQAGPRPVVDAVVGGFPCQPASEAGHRKGATDPRWLWPAMADVVGEIQPTWVVWENVPGLLTRGLDVVHRDLVQLRYRHRVGWSSACAVGAPHARRRLFGVAHAESFRCHSWWRSGSSPKSLESGGRGTQPRGPWADQPRPDGVAYGVPDGVDRRKGFGNAVVPQVAQHIGQLINSALPVGAVDRD